MINLVPELIIVIAIFAISINKLCAVHDANRLQWLGIYRLFNTTHQLPIYLDCDQLTQFGLNAAQINFCKNHTHDDAMHSVISAARLTIDVCMETFKNLRWNCSSALLLPKINNDLNKGMREESALQVIAGASLMAYFTLQCKLSNSCQCIKNNDYSDHSLNLQCYKLRYVNAIRLITEFLEFFSSRDELSSDYTNKQALDLVSIHNIKVGVHTWSRILDTCFGNCMKNPFRQCIIERCMTYYLYSTEPNSKKFTAWVHQCHNLCLIGQSYIDNCELRDCVIDKIPHLIMDKTGWFNTYRASVYVELFDDRLRTVDSKEIVTEFAIYRNGKSVYLKISPDFCDANPDVGSFGTKSRYCKPKLCYTMCCARNISYIIIKEATYNNKCCHVPRFARLSECECLKTGDINLRYGVCK